MQTKESFFPGVPERYRIYLFILIPIVLFNLVAIFGLDILYSDDGAQYYKLINGPILSIEGKTLHLILGRFTHAITFSIMSLSPILIRAIYVLFVMFPISCLAYRIFHLKMGFPVIAAYSAAVLPNILPAQIQIPVYVNGTHVLLGLLAGLASLAAAFKYLDTPDTPGIRTPGSRKKFMTAVLLYLAATLITDQPVFFFPVLAFAILGYNKFSRKHLFLAGSFFLVFLHKATWMYLVPRGSSRMVLPALSMIFKRLGHYFSAMLPLPQFLREHTIISAIIFILLIAAGAVLHIKNRDETFAPLKPFAHLSGTTFTYYIYGFLLTWFASNIFVYVTISPRNFRSRYFYYAAFGLIALLVISLYAILKKIAGKKKKWIILFFISLVLVSGVSRFFELKPYFDRNNDNRSKIVEQLSRFKFPEKSQIVIYLKQANNFRGTWRKSSGNLRYLLKRKDIDGLIGSKRKRYFNFYDPFRPVSSGPLESIYMRGLRLSRPLFLFVEKKKRFEQYEYALQWKGKAGASTSQWTIFHIDKQTGKAAPVETGIGMAEYLSALGRLESIGIKQEHILWGGKAPTSPPAPRGS